MVFLRLGGLISAPLSTTPDYVTRRRKADNQVTQFLRPIERQEVPATLQRRHLGACYQRAIMLALGAALPNPGPPK